MWPEGIRSAVALTVDLDGETPWTVKDPDIAAQPSALSMAQYGPRVGVPLILSLFDEMSVDSTFFIPGKSAEDYPETVGRSPPPVTRSRCTATRTNPRSP